MYMNAGLTKEELAKRISKLRQVMLRGGMTLDRKGYSLLLEASVDLEDPTVRHCGHQLIYLHNLQWYNDFPSL
jgi:hypothetical protein